MHDVARHRGCLILLHERVYQYLQTHGSVCKVQHLKSRGAPYTVTRDYSWEPNPYRSAFPSNREEEIEMVKTSPSEVMCPSHHPSSPTVAPQQCEDSASLPKAMEMTIQRSDTTSGPQGSNCVTVRITMPSNFGWRSWRWYEAVIETIAVGV